MLVNDEPAVALLAQADCEPKSSIWLLCEALRRTALEQGPRESDVLPFGDLEIDDVETRAGGLPLEEAGPGVAVGPQAAYPVVRGRHVEHHDVLVVISHDGIQVSRVGGLRPAANESLDLHEQPTCQPRRTHRWSAAHNEPALGAVVTSSKHVPNHVLAGGSTDLLTATCVRRTFSISAGAASDWSLGRSAQDRR